MKTIMAGIAMAIMVASCDTVEGMRDMKDTQDQLTGMIQEDIGVDALIGFNMNHGVLIDVSIGFSASDVNDRSVSELVRAARTAVNASFAELPRVIYIQIATTADQ